MNQRHHWSRRRTAAVACLVAATVMQFGFLDSCDSRLLTLTQFVDPCGTFLANCNPGDLQVQAANVGDYCIDPTCTVPGQCGGGQALGTITELCP